MPPDIPNSHPSLEKPKTLEMKKKCIQNESCKSRKELQTEITQTIEIQKQEILKYFNLNQNELQELIQNLGEINLDLFKLLKEYKNFIETNLGWLDEAIKTKIKTSIWLKVWLIHWKIKDLKKSDYYKNDFKNNKWIINSQIKELFEKTNTQVLPWAMIFMKDKDSKDAKKIKRHEKLDQMFKEDLNSDGDFKISYLESHWNNGEEWYKNVWKEVLKILPIGPYKAEALKDDYNYYKNNWNIDTSDTETNLDKVNLLSEKDEEIEKKAWMFYMAWLAVLVANDAASFSWVWTIPWAVAWWTYWAIDAFKREDLMISILKTSWIIPEEYRTDKRWIDNVLAWIWAIPLAWQAVRWLSKWAMVAKYVSKLNPAKLEAFNQAKDTMLKLLKKWEKWVEEIKSWVSKWVEKIWGKVVEKTIPKTNLQEKMNGFIDNLITKADPKTLSQSKEDIVLIWERAKKLILEISPDVLSFLVNIKDVLSDKLWGMNLKSLTHILESIVDWEKIPNNPKIEEILKKYGNISQSDFFAMVTIFHDLDKNFMPVAFLPDLHTILKWHNLTSHQLDSANLLKTLAQNPNISQSMEKFLATSSMNNLPNRNVIIQKILEIYKNVLNFFETKGITDPKKKNELLDLMFNMIKWHAANTEFIQVDSARWAIKTIGQIEWVLKDNNSIVDIKKWVHQFLDEAEKINFDKVTSWITDINELKELSKKFILQKYIKVNIGKTIPLDQINLNEFQNLSQWLNNMVKMKEFKEILLSGNITEFEKIIKQKSQELSKNREGMNKYLHNQESGIQEEMRFMFNLNDIIWYTKPNSEWFIKLIWLEWWPQYGLDLVMTSPMNSLWATLAELQSKIHIPEYKKMYENGLKNAQVLMDWYKQKLQTPFVWKEWMPEYLKWNEFQWKTFWVVYEKLCQIWPKNWDNLADTTKFPSQLIKDMAIIKQFFVSDFKAMCSDLKWVKDIYN